jgi:putative hydrolase of the HAD superfamily
VTTSSMPVAALVADFGGVLTTPVRDSLAAWLTMDQIDPDSFTIVLREWLGRTAAPGSPIHRLETGELAAPDFERQLAGRLRTVHGRPVAAAGLLDRMFATMAIDPLMVNLLRAARAGGVCTALLSNSWANEYPVDLLAELCDVVVISSEVGLRKPDRRIFDLVLDRLGVPGAATVFLDDAETNVLGARSAGMRAIVHRDVTSTRDDLAGLGLAFWDVDIVERAVASPSASEVGA